MSDGFAEQLVRIKEALRTKAPAHASGPKRPSLNDQEEGNGQRA